MRIDIEFNNKLVDKFLTKWETLGISWHSFFWCCCWAAHTLPSGIPSPLHFSLITLSARIVSTLELTGVSRLVGLGLGRWHQFTTKKNYFPNLSLNELHFLNNVHHRPFVYLAQSRSVYFLQHCSNSVASDPNYRWFWSIISGLYSGHQGDQDQLRWEMATLSVAHSFVLFVAKHWRRRTEWHLMRLQYPV